MCCCGPCFPWHGIFISHVMPHVKQPHVLHAWNFHVIYMCEHELLCMMATAFYACLSSSNNSMDVLGFYEVLAQVLHVKTTILTIK